jgi:hypothetical protein
LYRYNQEEEEEEEVYEEGEEEEEPPVPPSGSYEDLERFTHFIAEEEVEAVGQRHGGGQFPIPAEYQVPVSPARAWAPSPSPIKHHTRVSSTSPPQQPQPLSPLPPRPEETLPLFSKAPEKKGVSLQQVRLDNYEVGPLYKCESSCPMACKIAWSQPLNLNVDILDFMLSLMS